MQSAKGADAKIEVGWYQVRRLYQGALATALTQLYPTTGSLPVNATIRKIVATATNPANGTWTMAIAPGGTAPTGNTTMLFMAETVTYGAASLKDFGTDGLVVPAGNALWGNCGNSTTGPVNLCVSGGTEWQS